MTKEAQAEQAHEILSTEYTADQLEAARRFLQATPFTTTALAAIAVALRELCTDGLPDDAGAPQADVIDRCVRELALIEALEV
jgi:hypothetical protein